MYNILLRYIYDFLLLLIINLVNGFIFAYNTTTTSLKQINNNTSDNKDIFVFFQ